METPEEEEDVIRGLQEGEERNPSRKNYRRFSWKDNNLTPHNIRGVEYLLPHQYVRWDAALED